MNIELISKDELLWHFTERTAEKMDKYSELKNRIKEEISKNLDELISLNDYMADNPEISGEEYESSAKMVKILREHGFEVEYPFGSYPTSFKAVAGENNHRYKAAILVEYDALPGIGHACGHCVSGSMSVLAGIACAGIQDDLDCDIHVIGTPNEEMNGAKCSMVEEGLFDGYDFAMMIHLYNQNAMYLNLLALDSFCYTFYGKASHAAASPWEGINALNAATLMTVSMDLMRQQLKPDVRIHYIYRNGGAAPNIIPEETTLEIYARSLDRKYLNSIVDRIDKMAQGACLQTGCSYKKFPSADSYDNMLNVDAVIDCLAEVWDELGIEHDAEYDKNFGSSDIGNVSFVCPTLHPTLKLVDKEIAIHTREFEKAVKTPKAHELIALGAEVIANTIAKVFSSEENIAAVKKDFEAVRIK